MHVQNNIFKKRVPNMRFWINYILVRISFLGTALERFSQCFFFIFCRRSTMVVDIITQPPTPTMKKLSASLWYVHSMVICSKFISIQCNDKQLNEIDLATFIAKQICHFLSFRTLWLIFYTLLTNTCSKLKVGTLYWYTDSSQTQQ